MADTTWHYAVVVGIDEYPRIENGRKNLRGPMEDAEDMAAWLTDAKGGNLDPARVKLLTRKAPGGRSPPVPVLDEISDAILGCAADFVDRRKTTLPNEAARKAAWQKSRLYFYVSGHGIDDEGDDAALVTANASSVSLNHISTRNVLNKLTKERVFGELVILADCCREMIGVGAQPLIWDLTPYRGYNVRSLPRTFIGLASRNRQKAFEPGDKYRNSIFTQALLEGLKGGVSGNLVTSETLEKFLYSVVPKLAQEQKGEDQDPKIDGDPDIVFMHNSTNYQVTLTARPGSPFAALPAVDALETDKAVVRSRVPLPAAAPGVFKGMLATGFYAIVPPGGDPMAGSPVHALSVLGKDTDEAIG